MITKEWKKIEEERRLKKIQKMYSEVWHENETSIVIKMLDQSMKENDQDRVIELQKSLLELERKSDIRSEETTPKNIKNFDQLILKRTQSEKIIYENLSPKRSEAILFSPVEEEYLKKAIKQNTKQYDEKINIMIIGNQDVGKTSLMNSWLGSKVLGKPKHTIGY